MSNVKFNLFRQFVQYKYTEHRLISLFVCLFTLPLQPQPLQLFKPPLGAFPNIVFFLFFFVSVNFNLC